MKTASLLIEWGFSLFLCGLYYKSSIQKLRNPLGFVLVVQDYKVVSDRGSIYISPIIALAELLTGMWILFPWTRTIGAAAGMLLQIIFAWLMFQNIGKTFKYGCGCFQINTPSTITKIHVQRNIGLLVINGIVFVLSATY